MGIFAPALTYGIRCDLALPRIEGLSEC